MAKELLSRQGQRLCIYIDESDRWQGKPLYAAILESLKAAGLAGATVLRGVAGFGAHSYIRTASILRLSEDLPLRIEVIDSPEKIAQAIEVTAPMVIEGLITLEEVQVVKYTHRYLSPLPADRPVEEVMSRQVVTLDEQSSPLEAWKLMQERLLKGLPVVNAAGEPVGMLTDEDLLTRSGIKERLEAAGEWDEALLRREIAALDQSGQRAAALMSQPVITALASEPLGRAAARMARSGLKRLPVVDEQGRLVGVLSRVDVLRQVAEYQPVSKKVKLPVGAAVTAAEIMNPDLPVIAEHAPLREVVEKMLAYQARCLVVVDGQGRVAGLVNDEEVVRQVHLPERRGLRKALHALSPGPGLQLNAGQIMSAEALTCPPETTLAEAARFMLSRRRKWLVVTDEIGQPLGLVDRQILLSAIAGA